MSKSVNCIEAFNPSVFGLKDKPVDGTPVLSFHKAIDEVRQLGESEETRKVLGFNVYDENDGFIGWLYVFIGELGSLSYAEYKPGCPNKVFVFNQPLFAGPRDSDIDLVNLAQTCARHYHEYLVKNSGNICWSQIEIEMTELKPSQHPTYCDY